MGVGFRLAYLHLSFARNKDKGEGRAHFYCWYIKQPLHIAICQRIFCLLLFLACNGKSTRHRQILVKSFTSLYIITKSSISRIDLCFHCQNGLYLAFWNNFKTAELYLPNVIFGMRFQIKKEHIRPSKFSHSWISLRTWGYPPVGSLAEYSTSGCDLRQ